MIVITSEQYNDLAKGGIVRMHDNGRIVEMRLEVGTQEATGADIHEFYTKGWDNDYYYEQDDAKIDIEDSVGKWVLVEHEIYNLNDLGSVVQPGNPPKPGKPESMSFKEAFSKWRDSRTFTARVNGQEVQLPRYVGYKEVVEAAGFTADRILSVTFNNSHGNYVGSLSPSGDYRVTVKDGTIFNVADTSNA